MRLLTVFLVLFLLCSFAPSGFAFEDPGSFDSNKARVVSFIIRQLITSYHFSHKEVNDTLSQAAFTLYLKRLDGQKRFLLAKDVEKLKPFATLIDDEINSGTLDLPLLAAEIMTERARKVKEITGDILSSDLDFTIEEHVETDNEKLDFCATDAELKERWRKALKYQILHQYLTLIEDESQAAKEKKTDKPHQASSPEALLEKARDKVRKNIDSLISAVIDEKESEHYDRFFNAFANAFDPHTDFLPPMGKEDFDISMKGSLEGIGASLREEDGAIKVVEVITGGPAYRQGQLQPEDIILKVAEKDGDHVDITHMKLRDAIRLIRGKKGTEVTLTVRKPDSTRVAIAIVRDIVQLEDTFVKSSVLKDEKSGAAFGYLKIPSFYRDFEKTRSREKGRNVTDDVRSELKKMETENISGLIIDLRHNSGGALTDAVQVTGLFLKTGPVVQVKEGEGNVRVLSDTDPDVRYTGPLVVLVSTFSASASEIFAAALQDYGRAVIVGSLHTHGKGTVQSMIDLNRSLHFMSIDKYKPLGALKVTTQKFYRVTGDSNQYKGVIPDIVLPDRFASLKSGEKYLEYALPPDTIQPAPFEVWSSQPRIDLARLKKNSAGRISANVEFAEIMKDSRRIEELQKNTLKSLDIEKARRERDDERMQREGKTESLHRNREKKSADRSLNEKERIEQWIKELQQDAYIREALSVLADIITPAATLATSSTRTAVSQ